MKRAMRMSEWLSPSPYASLLDTLGPQCNWPDNKLTYRLREMWQKLLYDIDWRISVRYHCAVDMGIFLQICLIQSLPVAVCLSTSLDIPLLEKMRTRRLTMQLSDWIFNPTFSTQMIVSWEQTLINIDKSINRFLIGCMLRDSISHWVGPSVPCLLFRRFANVSASPLLPASFCRVLRDL